MANGAGDGPVALSATGSGLGRPTVLYLGWFGPRGLASIILALIVVQEADLAGTSSIVLLTAATVTLSVLAHGLTAVWGSNAYGDWCETHAAGAAAPEAGSTVPLRVPRRSGGQDG